MSIVKNRRQDKVSLEESSLKATSISSKSKIIKKANHKNSNVSVAIHEINKSSVKSSTDLTKREVPSSAVHKKNKLMLTQSRGGNIGRYPCKQMPSVIDIALDEIRREHSIVGDYNAVVGDLVMK